MAHHQTHDYAEGAGGAYGIGFTVLCCWPYLAGWLRFFPPTVAHDVVLAVVLAAIWLPVFLWEQIIRKHPIAQEILTVTLSVLLFVAMALLYSTVYYLIFIR